MNSSSEGITVIKGRASFYQNIFSKTLHVPLYSRPKMSTTLPSSSMVIKDTLLSSASFLSWSCRDMMDDFSSWTAVVGDSTWISLLFYRNPSEALSHLITPFGTRMHHARRRRRGNAPALETNVTLSCSKHFKAMTWSILKALLSRAKSCGALAAFWFRFRKFCAWEIKRVFFTFVEKLWKCSKTGLNYIPGYRTGVWWSSAAVRTPSRKLRPQFAWRQQSSTDPCSWSTGGPGSIRVTWVPCWKR